jgi:hypothetical protein
MQPRFVIEIYYVTVRYRKNAVALSLSHLGAQPAGANGKRDRGTVILVEFVGQRKTAHQMPQSNLG